MSFYSILTKTNPLKSIPMLGKWGVGAMLAQQSKGELKPVRFASRAEFRWHMMRFELYAIKWAPDQFPLYVLGKRTKIVTDHANLKWLTSVKPQQSKLTHWCLSMSEYDFYTEHKPGRYHIIPDICQFLMHIKIYCKFYCQMQGFP